MKKTYRGSCHCGAVQFEAELDLAAGTTRCNCRFCRKARFWMAFAKAAEFRMLKGQDALCDYQHTPTSKPEPFLHLTFCRVCGVRPFSSGGELAQFGGAFYAVNVACLDDATDTELAQAPIHYANGRENDWQQAAKETYL
ncbi:MAG TPA: GFA family protein [Polyangiaceae bacterium]|nr:GFA family protein [Polyangiaceae bacterium]